MGALFCCLFYRDVYAEDDILRVFFSGGDVASDESSTEVWLSGREEVTKKEGPRAYKGELKEQALPPMIRG